MQANLRTKLKVFHSIRPKITPIPRRRIRSERSTTPQRWSRRIKSLPPIPIDVLSPGRKIKVTRSLPNNKENQKIIERSFKSSISRIKKEKLLHKTSVCGGEGAYEIVRIVPVVVCVKRDKTKFRSLTDDLEIQIKKKNAPKACGNLKSVLREKLKAECSNLEKKWSKRLKDLPQI